MSTGRITRIEPNDPQESELRPGNYYEKVTELESVRDWGVPKGELVLITKVEGEKVHYTCGEGGWSWDRESFLKEFKYAPDGASRRQREVLQLMEEINAAQRETGSISEAINAFNPHVGTDGQIEGGDEVSYAERAALIGEVPEEEAEGESDVMDAGEIAANPTAALVAAASGVNAMESIQRNVAGAQNLIVKIQKRMAYKGKRLHALLKEQETAVAAQMKKFQEQIAVMKEISWTISIFMGSEEKIVCVKGGAPAPEGTIITIRQLVLYCDEESLIAADDGGMDFENLDEFDEWIKDPKHIQQVAPDPKCVVALKVRRHDKHYCDSPWLNSMMNEENRYTYFLVRNGERIYRIATELSVGETLFPVSTEFDEMFLVDNHHRDPRKRTKERMEPGSDAYMKAMKQASARERHYFRIILFLHALTMRTPVFNPLPPEGINLIDRKASEKYLRYVYDAEKLLPTGRLPFWQWQRELNEKLEVGHRIVGVFDLFGDSVGYIKSDDSRITPRRANRPDNLTLHTIERREKNALVILYKRTESYGEYNKRAACRLYRNDRFIINYDLATVDEMEFYLASRTDRVDYISLVPLLQTAIKMKRREAKAEAPFRKLLIGEIAKAHNVKIAEAASSIDDLISWWKFKNREYRALSKDDAKALRMIVTEFGHRLKRAAEREKQSIVHEAIIEQIRRAEPNVLFIGHKKGRTYLALVPHNAENVFVRETEWVYDPKAKVVTRTTEKEWRVVDSRRLRWEKLWASDRWEGWRFDARIEQHLTDPERDEASRFIWTDIARMVIGDRKMGAVEDIAFGEDEIIIKYNGVGENNRRGDVFWPLALTFQKLGELHAWFCDNRGVLPPKASLTKSRHGETNVHIAGASYKWEREGGKIGGALKVSYVNTNSYSISPAAKPWRPGYKGVLADGKDVLFLIWESNTVIRKLSERTQELKAANRERERLRSIVNEAGWIVERVMKEEQERKAFDKFMEEYGDAELWKDELKKLDLPSLFAHATERAAAHLVERGIDINGLTVGELFEKAEPFGFKFENDDNDLNVDRGIRIELKPSEEESVEEEDDEEEW